MYEAKEFLEANKMDFLRQLASDFFYILYLVTTCGVPSYCEESDSYYCLVAKLRYNIGQLFLVISESVKGE